jgi:hypothetical protein
VTSGESTGSSSPERAEGSGTRAAAWLLAASWAVPGLGHWILGKRLRAVVFAVIVVSAFGTGVLLGGELGAPKPHQPFSWLATFACFGNGLLYVVRMVWLNGLGDLIGALPFGLAGGGDATSGGFAYGNTFFYTGGLMNLLLVLDVSDIARGEKA